ncbi:ATP-binding protein [Myxococcus virescens]|uniref:HD domain-containing protein n=1 Tax=Myxococcus virescens TaxID=83456 RepID=UPI003DA6B345
MKFLEKDKKYAQRVHILREELDKWLQHTTALFPHYTSHARDHSEYIIIQISNFLFSKSKPTAKDFSKAEAYVLICAAYLHDAGMVVSPGEIAATLGSEQWKKFTTGPGASSYQEIESILARQDIQPSDTIAYTAGLQLRLMLADYFRREHHQRAPNVLKLHPALKQLVDFDDRRYFEAISSVAIAHGLDRAELNDPARFKEVVNLGGEKANIRFLAHLLRIGDLLDMRSSRANPYACTAAGPLPRDSMPHWQQYSTITHERVDFRRIEYTCKCQDQETHAILRDWFGWLCDEIRETGLAMLHSERHTGWRPPQCTLDDTWAAAQKGRRPPTIVIEPTAEAHYTFHRWRLELDQEKIFDRLIHDVYDSPQLFIRELIQNSLDATRCRMYDDYRARFPQHSPPAFPNQLPREFLDEYPIHISISKAEISFPRTDEKVTHQVLTIEDSGIGMDSETIRRYLLQVGRSYYQSEEFRTQHSFTPTSRFGVGFLSVFAVSRHITVETSKFPLPPSEPHGVRLTLQAPSSYLLTEKWAPFNTRPPQRRHGTRIRVALNEEIKPGDLLKLVRHWCQRVEVPILVTDVDQEETIYPNIVLDRSNTKASAVDPDAYFEIRSFKVNEPGLDGEVFRVAYINKMGESWLPEWDRSKDLTDSPRETPPTLPDAYISLHGINHRRTDLLYFASFRDPTDWHFAIDDRRASTHTTMARTGMLRSHQSTKKGIDSAEKEFKSIIQKHISEAVTTHLKTEPRAQLQDRWRYAGAVLSDDRVDPHLAWTWPETTPLRDGNTVQLYSAFEVSRLPELTVVFRTDRIRNQANTTISTGRPTLNYAEAPRFLREWIDKQIQQGGISQVQQAPRGHIAITLTATHQHPTTDRCMFLDFQDTEAFAIKLYYQSEFAILNSRHPFTAWVALIQKTSTTEKSVVSPEMASALLQKTRDLDPRDFDTHLSQWRTQASLPSNLLPPNKWGWHLLYSNTFRLR